MLSEPDYEPMKPKESLTLVYIDRNMNDVKDLRFLFTIYKLFPAHQACIGSRKDSRHPLLYENFTDNVIDEKLKMMVS